MLNDPPKMVRSFTVLENQTDYNKHKTMFRRWSVDEGKFESEQYVGVAAYKVLSNPLR